MGIGRTNAGGGGTGATLTVTAPAGVTVTAAKDGKTYTRTANAQGIAVFKGLATGTWAVTISDGTHNPTTQQVLITADYAVTISFFAATISVTYPAGSTCTCTKGSQVLTAPGTSGSYTFTVPETGDWVVSCTDGEQTASETVSITANGQTESVVLSYDCKMYENGNEYTLTTGGWTGINLTKDQKSLTIGTSSSTSNRGMATTNNFIDLSKYKTLNMIASATLDEYKSVALIITTDKMANDSNEGTIAKVSQSVNSIANKQITLDIPENLPSDGYYVKLFTWNTTLTVSKVWAE